MVALLTAQNIDWQWINSYGSYAAEAGSGIVHDSQGYVYTTGTLPTTAYFGTELIGPGAFVTKHNRNGELLWAVCDGTNTTKGLDIDIDPLGNIYIQGSYEGPTTIGTTNLSSIGNSDIFVAKLNNDGIWQWAKQAGGSSYDYPKKIAVDGNGNVIIIGTTHDGSFGPYLLSGFWRAYIAKLSTDGDWQWVSSHTGNNYNSSYDVAVGSDGSIYYFTTVMGSVTAGEFSFTSNHMDFFIGKIDPTGNWLAYYRSTGSAPEYSDEITVAPDGSIYVTGHFYTQLGSPLFGTISPPAFGTLTLLIGRISTSGSWEWVKSGGASGTSQSNRGYGVATDVQSNVYVTGNFNNTASYGAYTVTTQGGLDIFIASLDPLGNWRWASSAGGTGTDIGWGITALGVDEVFTCGQFANTATFGDLSVSTEPSTLSYTDIYIAGFGYPAPAGPAAPANLAIQIQDGSVLLTWDAVTQDTNGQPLNVNRYCIYYHDHPEGEYVLLGESTQSQFIIPGNQTTNKDFFKVTALVD